MEAPVPPKMTGPPVREVVTVMDSVVAGVKIGADTLTVVVGGA